MTGGQFFRHFYAIFTFDNIPQTAKVVVVGNFYHGAIQLLVNTFGTRQIFQAPFANTLVKLQSGGSRQDDLSPGLGQDT